MGLNQTIRGRFGATITEAAVVMGRGLVFKNRAASFQWDRIDADEPGESPVPVWKDEANKLDKDLLWELVGPANTPTGTNAQLRNHLLREIGNRQKVWTLMRDAVTAVQGGAETDFMKNPLDAANAAGCTNVAGGPINLQELMRILHMFGKSDSTHAPRPMHPILAEDYFYKDEEEVVVEIGRRVRELAAGITWEGNVTGGREKKKPGVWNRYGMYCGCG